MYQASIRHGTDFIEIYGIMKSRTSPHGLTKLILLLPIFSWSSSSKPTPRKERRSSLPSSSSFTIYLADDILFVFSHQHEATCILPARVDIICTTVSTFFNAHIRTSPLETRPTRLIAHSTIINQREISVQSSA